MALTDTRISGDADDPMCRRLLAALDDAGIDAQRVDYGGKTIHLRTTADVDRLILLAKAVHA